ncbi:MAG: ATP-binding cassette domain-containing protein [Candidatus Helarchaeota archaeon]
MNSNHVLLKIEDLVKKYEYNSIEKVVLKNINLELNVRNIFGIIGNSSTGKSTLLRIIHGIEAFNEGIVKINGSKNLKEFSTYYPQHYFGLYHDSVINNLMKKFNALESRDETQPLPDIGSSKYNNLRNLAENLLKNFDLYSKADLNVKELTAAEKQILIVLKQFIIKENSLIILDSPFSMLDQNQLQSMLDFIKKFCKERNNAVIISSDNMSALKYLCDQVGILKDGELKIVKNLDDNFYKNIPKLFPFKPLELPSSENSNSIIELNEISFGNHIKEINLEIYEGEVLGIIGMNGSCKSLLLKLISGLVIPDDGKIIYLGNSNINITKFGIESINALKNTNYIPQCLNIHQRLNVYNFVLALFKYKSSKTIQNIIENHQKFGLRPEILDFIVRIHSISGNNIKDKLDKLNISTDVIDEIYPSMKEFQLKTELISILNDFKLEENILDKNISDLSITELKLIILIAYLLMKPKILILDEFDSEFDLISKRELANNLLKINSQYNITIIFSTHDPRFLKDLAHRALILEKGSINKIDAPEDVYEIFMKDLKKNIKYLMNFKNNF